MSAASTTDRRSNARAKVATGARRAGAQGGRLILLAVIVVLSGMAVGYAAGYPLRFVEYEASSAVALDQASLAGTIEVANALVAAEDLGPGWAAGDPVLGGFGVLGADVCGEAIETPTPLSAVEVAVWQNETNGATIIAQALRVDSWKSAEEYVDDVADALEECETFFRTDGEERVEVTSSDIDRDPPVTDHVDRRYQSPDGVQEWSMMSVGDVIVAIQYLAPTPPPESFLGDVERSVLIRIAPDDFAPGIGSDDVDGLLPADTTVPAEGEAPPATPDDPADAEDPAAGDPAAPDETGGP